MPKKNIFYLSIGLAVGLICVSQFGFGYGSGLGLGLGFLFGWFFGWKDLKSCSFVLASILILGLVLGVTEGAKFSILCEVFFIGGFGFILLMKKVAVVSPLKRVY